MGKNPGTTKLSVTLVNAGTKAVTDKATITVKVLEKVEIQDPEKPIILHAGKNGTCTVSIGDTVQLQPEDGLEVKSWKSSNGKVASVTDDGLVTALKPGKSTIKATLSNDKTASFVVNVINKDALTHVKLSHLGKVPMKVGETLQLSAAAFPSNEGVTFTWKCSPKTKATVKNGLVTALKPGTVKITVTAKQGKITKKATVQVVIS